MEEALYDSAAMRRFAGIDLGREPVPHETAVCRFRHLLEGHDLGRQLFDEVQRQLAAKGLKVATGTIVDATIINAPTSTKNADKARDPEMHQTKKGNQWYFGMKGHFGVDSRSKLIHAVAATPANVADSTVLPELLHGRETRVWGDQAYLPRAARGDPGARAQGSRFHQSSLSPPRCCRQGRAGEKPHQVQSAGPGRTRDQGHQAGVRLCQGALSRAEQEPPSSARHLRAGQSVHRAPAFIALPGGVMCPQSGRHILKTSQCGIHRPNHPVSTASKQIRHVQIQPSTRLFRRSLEARPSLSEIASILQSPFRPRNL